MGKRLFKLLLAYSSILLGFYFAFAIVFFDQDEMTNMIYRINKILSMSMGEVDPNILKNVPRNSTFNFYQREFWEEVHPGGHLIFTVFCLTVPMLILNILTAFAIKVCLIQYSASPLVCSCSCLRTWTWFSEMPRSTN